MKYEKLHESIYIGNLELKNRLVMPPMATEKSADGQVSDRLVGYYDEKTRGGWLGLVIQEHSFVSQEGKASPNQVSIASDDMIPELKKITDAIHANGVPVFAQLAHAGSAAKEEMTGLASIGPSPVLNPRHIGNHRDKQVLPQEMTREDISRVVKAFADAAERAKKAGYDGVEIHAAHGYLLDQFYSPLTNKRTDEYGPQNVENRTRLHREVIKEVRERVGSDYPVGMRFGSVDYAEGGAALEDAPRAAALLADEGLDMLSISGGMCDYMRPGHSEPGWFSESSELIKKTVGIPVLLTGGIKDGDAAEALLEENKADLTGIGRAILKDSSLPEKLMKA